MNDACDRPDRSVTLRSGRLLVGTALVLLAAGCGGGGGGGGGIPSPVATVTGNGAAPTTGAGDTQGYFPLATGNQWRYAATNSDPAAAAALGTLTATITGTQTVLGLTASVMSRVDTTVGGAPINAYYKSGGGGITFLGNTDVTDTIDPLVVPYVQLLFPVSVGTQSTVTGSNLAFGQDMAGNPITLNFTQTIVNNGFESVNLPAGSFSNALKQVTTVTGTATDSGHSVAVFGSDTAWLVPGVGIAQENTMAGAGGNSATRTFALQGYAINGQRFGLQPATAWRPLYANTFGNAVSMASDGTHFLMLLQKSTSPNAQNWVASVMAADGTVQSMSDVNPMTAVSGYGNFPYAVAAFDGTNYLLVYTQDQPNGQATTIDAVGVSATGAALGPAVTIANLSNAPEPETFALQFDGTRFLLVYPQSHASANDQLSGVFLTPTTGQPIGAPFAIAPAGGHQSHPVISFDGTNYLVAWDETLLSTSLGLNAVRVSTAGAVLDPQALLVDSEVGAPPGGYQPTTPTLAFDGTNYLVAYRDARSQPPGNSTSASVSAARISPAGVLLDGSSTVPGIMVSTDKSAIIETIRAIFFDGQYWIVWQSGVGEELFAARVSTGGAITSPGTSGFDLIAAGADPVLAANPPSALLAWSTGSGASNSVTLQGIYPVVH